MDEKKTRKIFNKNRKKNIIKTLQYCNVYVLPSAIIKENKNERSQEDSQFHKDLNSP